MKNNLKHIAIVMDGNGRWAKHKNLPLALGHKQGAEAARKVIISCLKKKIPYLTLYTFSSENRSRNHQEIEDLMNLLRIYLTNELKLLIKHKVKLKVIGDKTLLPEDIVKLINHSEDITKNNTNLLLQLALSYGGREEIVNAQKKLFSDIICDKIKAQDINSEIFEHYLYTANIPDPDLFIRTGGEFRISNFLLWQIAYTELYFTKVLWPDFNSSHLGRAISNFFKRERRYGLSKHV